MAKEIIWVDETGRTEYANLTNSVGQWYNTVGAAFEAFNAANWTDYDLAGTEFGTSGMYSADMPAVAAGAYSLSARHRAGGSPAQTDAVVAAGEIQWDGSAVVTMSSRATQASVDTVDDFLDTEVAAIKGKTDSLTFTVAGQLDANIQSVNDVAVTGTGQSGSEWGPA